MQGRKEKVCLKFNLSSVKKTPVFTMFNLRKVLCLPPPPLLGVQICCFAVKGGWGYEALCKVFDVIDRYCTNRSANAFGLFMVCALE